MKDLKAISINPKHADSYCNLGLSYLNMKQYDKALENYNKAIELKQDFDAAILNRGNLFFIIGNRTLSLADYRKACDLGNSRACEVLSLAGGE
jgi:lipoprotein NlpI